jgi:hypothetical protein
LLEVEALAQTQDRNVCVVWAESPQKVDRLEVGREDLRFLERKGCFRDDMMIKYSIISFKYACYASLFYFNFFNLRNKISVQA